MVGLEVFHELSELLVLVIFFLNVPLHVMVRVVGLLLDLGHILIVDAVL